MYSEAQWDGPGYYDVHESSGKGITARKVSH